MCENYLFIIHIAGVECESECPLGFYGNDCHIPCDCLNESSCNRKTGKCNCARGWTGSRCEIPCKIGYYGYGCKETCPNAKFG